MRNGWDLLAEAIILQAVQDYRALGRGPIYYGNERQQVNDDEIKEFFYSKWFTSLSTLDGKYIFRMLKKERENESIARSGYIRPRRVDR